LTSRRCAPNVRSPHAARAPGSADRRGATGRPGPEPIGPGQTGLTRAAAFERRRERLPGGLGAQPQERALDRPRDPLPTRVRDLPPLPDAYGRVLDAGLTDLGITLDDAAREAIAVQARFLLAWTAAINLTAIREPAEVARLHVLDSLVAVPYLRRHGARALLDIGSGAGYPGLPLAIALGADRALLVDSVGKKVRFLETVIAATGLGRTLAAETTRAEALARDGRDREAWPVVTARAVAPLAELVELALPLVAPGGRFVAWKRVPLDVELAVAGPALAALRAGPVEIVEPGLPGLEGHCLVVVPRGGPVPAQFPRDPAERRRRPL
jgi:16S rRNA (guanine527-N7)-methyltransferase